MNTAIELIDRDMLPKMLLRTTIIRLLKCAGSLAFLSVFLFWSETSMAQCVGSVTTVTIPINIGCGAGEGGRVSWDGPVGGIINEAEPKSATFSITWTVAGNFRVKRSFPGSCPGTPLYREFTVLPSPSAPPPQPVIVEGCNSISIGYNGTPPSGVEWHWQGKNPDERRIDNSVRYVVSEPGTYYLRARNLNGCWGNGTSSITVSKDDFNWKTVPLVDFACSYDGQSVTLSTDNSTDRWFINQSSTAPLSSTNALTRSISPATLYVERTLPGVCKFRVPYMVDESFVLKCASPVNGVRTTKPIVPGHEVVLTTPAIRSIDYFDGIGRDLQSILVAGSPLEKDLVQPISYDLAGRKARSYLPYVSADGNGAYKSDAIKTENLYTSSKHYQYYNNGTDNVADDIRPFSETIFEKSSLDRPTKTYGPGTSWFSQGRSQDYQYLVNRHGDRANEEKIIAWTLNSARLPVRVSSTNSGITAGGYYDTGNLTIRVFKDEAGNQVREFIDSKGFLVLKKVQVVLNPVANNDSHWAQTYYIYDAYGNLVMVIPPEAVKALAQN